MTTGYNYHNILSKGGGGPDSILVGTYMDTLPNNTQDFSRKLDLIRECLDAYELSNMAKLICIGIIVESRPPSEKCKQWAIDALRSRGKITYKHIDKGTHTY